MTPLNAIKLTERQVQDGLDKPEGAIRKLGKLNLLDSEKVGGQLRYPLGKVMELAKWRNRPLPEGTYGLVCHLGVEDGTHVPQPWYIPGRNDLNDEQIAMLSELVAANPDKYGNLPEGYVFAGRYPVSAENVDRIIGGKLMGDCSGFISASATILAEISEAYDGRRYFIVLPDRADDPKSPLRCYIEPESGPIVRVIL